MSWNFLIAFFIAVGVYALVVLVIAFIKRYKNKKNKVAPSDKEEDKQD